MEPNLLEASIALCGADGFHRRRRLIHLQQLPLCALAGLCMLNGAFQYRSISCTLLYYAGAEGSALADLQSESFLMPEQLSSTLVGSS